MEKLDAKDEAKKLVLLEMELKNEIYLSKLTEEPFIADRIAELEAKIATVQATLEQIDPNRTAIYAARI